MNKKKVIYIGILLIITVMVSITAFSYAYLTRTDEQHGKLNMTVGNLDYKIESDDLNNNSITLGANESKEIELTIRSLNQIDSKYKLYTNNVENVTIGYLDETGFDESTGTISANGTVKVKIVLDNESDTSKTITFGVQGGFDYNEVALKSGRVEIEEGQALCPLGMAYEFDYTGSVQEFTAKCPGVYKLETWGAQGGSVEGMINYSGGKGGYSKGEITLTTSQTLYVVVGGRGNSVGNNNVSLNDGTGYNGGGSNTYQGTNEYYGSGGGGATHIATASGILASLSSNTSSILIVAGGGGGSSTSSTTTNNETTNGQGGYGGGLTGGNGTTTYTGTDIRTPGTGGTQTTIGVTDSRTSTYTDATFGSGCLVDSIYGGYMRVSGGGGYYGGGCGIHSGGGGGSSYIGGVTNGQTIAGNLTITEPNGTQSTGHSGNGYARITYLGPANITFNVQGGTSSEPTRQVVYGNEIGTLPTPTYTGKYFIGWYLEDTYQTKVESNYIVTSDITLYAKWDDIVVTYNYLTSKPSATTEEATYNYNSTKLNITTSATNTANLGSRIVFNDEITTGGVLNIKGTITINSNTTTSKSKISIGLGSSARATDKGIYIIANDITAGSSKSFDDTIEIPDNTYVTIMIGRKDQNITGGTLNSTITIDEFNITNY